MTCRPFTAAEAHAVRFLSRVAPDDHLDAEVETTASSLATKPGFLIRHTKQLVNAVVEEAFPTRQSFRDAEITIGALHDEESRVAMQRYLDARDRRKPTT